MIKKNMQSYNIQQKRRNFSRGVYLVLKKNRNWMESSAVNVPTLLVPGQCRDRFSSRTSEIA